MKYKSYPNVAVKDECTIKNSRWLLNTVVNNPYNYILSDCNNDKYQCEWLKIEINQLSYCSLHFNDHNE